MLNMTFFEFHKVKWLHLTNEVDKSVRYSCQFVSGFNCPKVIKIGSLLTELFKKIKRWTFWAQCSVSLNDLTFRPDLLVKKPCSRSVTARCAMLVVISSSVAQAQHSCREKSQWVQFQITLKFTRRDRRWRLFDNESKKRSTNWHHT